MDSPLKIVRPFPLTDGRVVLQILTIGPGILEGDTFELNFRVARGAKVVIVNQSATRLHAMPGGAARQRLEISVESGGELEYYPGLVIPYRDAEYQQTSHISLQPGARFGSLERWSVGRVAAGEAFGFRRLSSRLQIRRGQRLVYADGLELTPRSAALTGVLDGHAYLASGVWLWNGSKDDAGTDEKQILRPVAGEISLVHGSFGEGRYLRCLGSDGPEQAKQIGGILRRWRETHALAPLRLERFGPGI